MPSFCLLSSGQNLWGLEAQSVGVKLEGFKGLAGEKLPQCRGPPKLSPLNPKPLDLTAQKVTMMVLIAHEARDLKQPIWLLCIF